MSRTIDLALLITLARVAKSFFVEPDKYIEAVEMLKAKIVAFAASLDNLSSSVNSGQFTFVLCFQFAELLIRYKLRDAQNIFLGRG